MNCSADLYCATEIKYILYENGKQKQYHRGQKYIHYLNMNYAAIVCFIRLNLQGIIDVFSDEILFII